MSVYQAICPICKKDKNTILLEYKRDMCIECATRSDTALEIAMWLDKMMSIENTVNLAERIKKIWLPNINDLDKALESKG